MAQVFRMLGLDLTWANDSERPRYTGWCGKVGAPRAVLVCLEDSDPLSLRVEG